VSCLTLVAEKECFPCQSPEVPFAQGREVGTLPKLVQRYWELPGTETGDASGLGITSTDTLRRAPSSPVGTMSAICMHRSGLSFELAGHRESNSEQGMNRG
jgi:hypothetical protein